MKADAHTLTVHDLPHSGEVILTHNTSADLLRVYILNVFSLHIHISCLRLFKFHGCLISFYFPSWLFFCLLPTTLPCNEFSYHLDFFPENNPLSSCFFPHFLEEGDIALAGICLSHLQENYITFFVKSACANKQNLWVVGRTQIFPLNIQLTYTQGMHC